MNEEDVQFIALKTKRDSDLKTLFQRIENTLKDDNRGNMILLDLNGFFISNSFKSSLVDFLSRNSHKKLSLSMMGVGKGVRKVILQSIDFPFYFADDKEDAVDWFQGIAEIE